EAISDDAATVAHHVRYHGDEARRHFREVDIGVPDRRCDRLGDFDDIDDAHYVFLPRVCCLPPARGRPWPCRKRRHQDCSWIILKAGFGSGPMLFPELVMLIRHYQWN